MQVVVDSKLLGNKIRKLRLSNGMLLRDIAEQCGYTVAHIHHIEYGTKNCNLQLAINIANIFGITVDELCSDAVKEV